ncbi:ankyrin repeat domain-containing protein [Vibrio sp. S4M6]|nr:ankyrin repeat domain-containing protein [Vibrio sinus]MCL9783464.1 ankyrin repeat domain-containing protein [Vibrio sinus]
MSLFTSFLSSAASKSHEAEYQSLVSLFFDAVRTGNSEVMTTFLQAGFPVDQRNTKSYTPLMVAAYQGQASAVALLLEHGANACIRDKRGNTALMGALIKGEVRIAKRLYQANCSPEARNKAGLNLQEFARLYGQARVLQSFEDNSGSAP